MVSVCAICIIRVSLPWLLLIQSDSIGLIYLNLQFHSFNQLIQSTRSKASEPRKSNPHRSNYLLCQSILLFHTKATISAHAMSNAMSNKSSNTGTNSEGQNSTPFSHGWHFTRPNNSSYADSMSSTLTSHAHSTLAPFPDAISVLTPTPECLSTSAQRLVPEWWTCCKCQNLVNPNLAPERKCPICSHVECDFCGTEVVP